MPDQQRQAQPGQPGQLPRSSQLAPSVSSMSIDEARKRALEAILMVCVMLPPSDHWQNLVKSALRAEKVSFCLPEPYASQHVEADGMHRSLCSAASL